MRENKEVKKKTENRKSRERQKEGMEIKWRSEESEFPLQKLHLRYAR